MSVNAELTDERRPALLQKIEDKSNELTDERMGTDTWLFFWFADIEKLEHYASDAASEMELLNAAFAHTEKIMTLLCESNLPPSSPFLLPQ